MAAPADDRDPINAGSPETPPPATPVRAPGGRRSRLAPVLRLVLAGTLVLAVLGPVQLAEWSESRPLLAQSPAVQTAIEQLDQTHASFSFPRAYEWVRRQTRALQALRFNADAGNQQ